MRGTGVGRDQRLRKEGIEPSGEESTPQKGGNQALEKRGKDVVERSASHKR